MDHACGSPNLYLASNLRQLWQPLRCLYRVIQRTGLRRDAWLPVNPSIDEPLAQFPIAR